MRANRLLILGGTAEGRALAEAAQVRFGSSLAVISALAGRTRAPRLPAGHVRIGGFGGADGLAAYLCAERIGLLIDATHPFATHISAHASDAAARAGAERLAMVRPPWRKGAGDRWIDAATVEDAAAALPAVGQARLPHRRRPIAGTLRSAFGALVPGAPGGRAAAADPPRPAPADLRARALRGG